MERISQVFSKEELNTLNRAIEVYKRTLLEKSAELDQCQTHLKVNEALMQEVRVEKDRIRKELTTSEMIIKKFAEGNKP